MHNWNKLSCMEKVSLKRVYYRHHSINLQVTQRFNLLCQHSLLQDAENAPLIKQRKWENKARFIYVSNLRIIQDKQHNCTIVSVVSVLKCWFPFPMYRLALTYFSLKRFSLFNLKQSVPTVTSGSEWLCSGFLACKTCAESVPNNFSYLIYVVTSSHFYKHSATIPS